jgi:hypothetical protein
MAAAFRRIGSRPSAEPAPNLTLDVVMYLGILLLAAVLLLWRLPPVEYSSWSDDVNGLRTASFSSH